MRALTPTNSPKPGSGRNLSPLQETKNALLSLATLGNAPSCDHFDLAEEDLALELPDVQLEALADAFQEMLFKTGKVQDRQLRNRPVPQSFQGNHAVDVLHKLLLEQSGLNEISRNQAVRVGRKIQTQFHFFVHNLSTAKKHYPLQDCDHDLYQFDHNLPMQVYKVRKQYPSLWDKVTLLENRVPLKDHRGLVKVHNNCFLAKEAVDVLMQVKLVKSRKEAVHMIQKLNEKVYCCRLADHPGNDGTNFQDDTQLYRFVPKEERIKPPPTRTRSHSPARKHNKKLDSSMQDVSSKSHHSHRRRDRANSPAKDAAYFQNRAQGVRDRLDQHRQERAQSPNRDE